MSDHESSFLKALVADENDANIRLIYADWLDEQGRHEEADRQRKWTLAREWLMVFSTNEDIQESMRFHWKEFWERFSTVLGVNITVRDYEEDEGYPPDSYSGCPSC